MKKMLLMPVVLSTLLSGATVFAAHSPDRDSFLANNEDRRLSIPLGKFVRSPIEPESLVHVQQGGSGPSYFRYTAVADRDVVFVNSLKPNTPYTCSFQNFANMCYQGYGCGTYYRFLVIGVSCQESR